MSQDWPLEEQKPGLPAVVAVPQELAARIALVEDCWSRLSLNQRTFLTAWRENRFNARRTAQILGMSSNTKPMTAWMAEKDFAVVVQVWRATAASEILEKDRLVLRQDDIVEALLEPKPILHQGVPTGFEEIDAGAAARANEALLDRVYPKPRADVEINVGVAFTPPSVDIGVVKTAGGDGEAVNAEFVEVSPVLPEGDCLDEVGADSGEVLPRQ